MPDSQHDTTPSPRTRSTASRIRLLASLGVATMLVAFLGYVALAPGDVTKAIVEVGQLRDPETKQLASDGSVQLVGVARSVDDSDTGMVITLGAEDGSRSVDVAYTGSIPDAFRVGRNVLVEGTLAPDGTFTAEPDSLTTKCPSRFQEASDEPA